MKYAAVGLPKRALLRLKKTYRGDEPMNIVNALNIDRELVLEFLAFFARFEYALKRGGYALGGEKRVDVNWDSFAQDLRKLPPAQLESVLALGAALMKEPPKKQVLINDSLAWKDAPHEAPSDIEKILIYVRRVRNNLFHGGKFPVPTGPVDEPARNEALIRSSLAVLQAALIVPGFEKLQLIFEPDI
jgi:hypothetical protein